jgi:hypothetical protein
MSASFSSLLLVDALSLMFYLIPRVMAISCFSRPHIMITLLWSSTGHASIDCVNGMADSSAIRHPEWMVNQSITGYWAMLLLIKHSPCAPSHHDATERPANISQVVCKSQVRALHPIAMEMENDTATWYLSPSPLLPSCPHVLGVIESPHYYRLQHPVYRSWPCRLIANLPFGFLLVTTCLQSLLPFSFGHLIYWKYIESDDKLKWQVLGR